MWWKLRTPGIFRGLLVLALIVTASLSCERERKTDKPDRERPPQPKLENPSTPTIVPLGDRGVTLQ
jgi:hypothetical protein